MATKGTKKPTTKVTKKTAYVKVNQKSADSKPFYDRWDRSGASVVSVDELSKHTGVNNKKGK